MIFQVFHDLQGLWDNAQLFYFTYMHSRAATKIDVINSNVPGTRSGVSGLQRVKIVIFVSLKRQLKNRQNKNLNDNW